MVDDDDDLREVLVEVLTDAGYTVEAAASGLEALALLTTLRPCLILLDLMMPGLSGWEVVETLQKDPVLAAIPVCILSAVAEQAPEVSVSRLQKPVPLPVLLDAVAQHC
ncbi:MAG TPA: response regulator [Kofleriaceae bacterium]|nr:response regulator [Kofleriaceae bacterium]